MNMPSLLIYFIAFLEGFTTLSVEIVLLRKFSPVIGSNSISTSVVLGVVLLALSYGYYIGGKSGRNSDKIPGKLLKNLFIAAVYYGTVSFLFSESILELLLFSTKNYFVSILLTTVILVFIPVFLASQTIPLLSGLLKEGKASEKMGKLLFYSTVGSFMGSVLTSTLFFGLIGATSTGILNACILLVLFIIIWFCFFKKRQLLLLFAISFLALFISIIFGYQKATGNSLFSTSNAYHNITVFESGESRFFSLNGAYSSGIDIETGNSNFEYIKEVIRKIEASKPENILLIGAAGFTFAQEISRLDSVKNVDVVDIDESLKLISEEYFLQEKLSDKIVFYPQPARYFISNNSDKKYDVVFIDAFAGKSIPSQLLTEEFFTSISDIGEDIYMNIIVDTKFREDLSKNILSTFGKVFTDASYKNTNSEHEDISNFIITNNNNSSGEYTKIGNLGGNIYTDDKNSIELDLFKFNTFRFNR